MEKETEHFPPSSPEERELEAKKARQKEAENLALQERLSLIIRTISGKPNLEVTAKINPADFLEFAKKGEDARKLWFRTQMLDPVTKKQIGEYVHIPDFIVETTEDVAKGTAAHEAGHAAITRSGQFIPDNIMQELGFQSVIGASEERPTDQVVRERFPGAGEWITEMRQGSLNQAVKGIRGGEETGYYPKFIQLQNLIVYGPHLEQFSNAPELQKEISPEVTELYKKIKRHVERIEGSIPKEGSLEEETVEWAKKRYKIFYSRIWPEVKKIIEEDLQKEKLRQMVNQAQQNPGAPDNPLNQLPEELKQELESAMEKMLEEMAEEAQKRQKGKAGMKPEEKEGKEKMAESAESKETEEEAKKETGEAQEPPKKGEPEKEGELKKEGEPKKEMKAMPIPMDQLSQALLEALEKAFKRLSKEKQEALKEMARQALEELEDAIVEELSGKLVENPPETHKEFRERKDEEQKEREKITRQQKIEGEMKEIERKQAALREERSRYDQTYEEIRELDEELYRRLEEIFTPNIKRTTRLISTGAKINLPAVFRWEAGKKTGAKTIDSRIFETTRLPEKKDYAFTILVDLSGSMSRGEGEKIKETFKAAVLLAEVLNRLGVKFEILGFHTEVFVFKKFDEEFTEETRRKMSGMIEQAIGEDTYLGHALFSASRSLKEQPAKEKFLIAMTDGIPGDPDKLEQAVKDIIQKTNQKLIGLGLGLGEKDLTKYFPNSIADITAKELKEILAGLLEDMIQNPQKYANPSLRNNATF